MQPGWLMPCFDVADLARSLEFYAGLGFRMVGGKQSDGWAVIANGPIELGLFRGHFDGWMLNFRGDNVVALTAKLSGLGLPITHQSRYDATHAPVEWSTDSSGSPLPCAECGECLLSDPDGNVVFLDTVPTERARFLRRELYAADGYDGSYLPGQPKLGTLRVELHTAQLPTLAAFYLQLGLIAAPPASDGSIELSTPGLSWRIVLVPSTAAAAKLVFVGSQTTARELTDPDEFQLSLR